MTSDTQSVPVDEEEVKPTVDSYWSEVWIYDTFRLNQCRFKLFWNDNLSTYEKDLIVGINHLPRNKLYQASNLRIEITNKLTSSKFYINTLPVSVKDSNYTYEDLSITYSSDGASTTPYEYFYICPKVHQLGKRSLIIHETHLDLRHLGLFSDRGIDIDWKFSFRNWLGGYGEEESVHSSVEKPQAVNTPTLSTVKEYGWPEGFTVWLKTSTTDEERIRGTKKVNVVLSAKPESIIKKNGKQVAVIYSKDKGSWDLGLCWEVEQSGKGIVKHVYRPPLDDEGNEHDLYVSPSWITLCNYPHTSPNLGSNRGIAADISKDLSIWMGENELLAAEGSSAQEEEEESSD